MKANGAIKRICALLLAALFLPAALAGCGSGLDPEVRAFLRAEDGYNDDIQNAVARYGTVLEHVTTDYMDGTADAWETYYTGDDVVVTFENGVRYIRYGNVWYAVYPDEAGGASYGQLAVFDGVSDYDATYALLNVVFSNEAHLGVTLTEGDDGSFVWKSHYLPAEGGTVNMTILVNPQYEVTEITSSYYAEDETWMNTRTLALTFGETDTEAETAREDLAAALAAADGATRHIAIHTVSNGAVAETFEVDVPRGFLCYAVLPEACYDAENRLTLYWDMGLTRAVDEIDRNADQEVYCTAQAEK